MAQKTWMTEEEETREETKEIRETEDIRMDRRDRGEMEAEEKITALEQEHNNLIE